MEWNNCVIYEIFSLKKNNNLAFETHGATHSSALDFLNAVGGRSAAESGDPRETSFLWQRISILIQWFNAILISETFSCTDEAPDL